MKDTILIVQKHFSAIVLIFTIEVVRVIINFFTEFRCETVTKK